jgi:hypothetical protein
MEENRVRSVYSNAESARKDLVVWMVFFFCNYELLQFFVVILDGAEHDNGEQAEEMLPTWGEALIRPEKGIPNLGLKTFLKF